MRKIVAKITERGIQVRTDKDRPDGSFGTIIAPPYRTKTDALRTGGQLFVIYEEDMDKTIPTRV